MFVKIAISSVLFFFSTVFLFAETLQVKYRVSYGLFGDIGTADAVLTKNNEQYTITIALEATGLAKTLSQGRKEKHISKGHMQDGVMISDSYQVIRSYASKHTIKTYTINHTTQSVVKRYVKKENGKIISQEEHALSYYAKNDLLTLYFNLGKLIKDKHKAQQYTFHAVGAEKQSGKVRVIIPEASALKRYKKLLGGGASWYATAIIYQKIFSSREGKLMLAVDEKGITQKAVLKDVIFFGDIVAQKE